jgi:hypothetical protein
MIEFWAARMRTITAGLEPVLAALHLHVKIWLGRRIDRVKLAAKDGSALIYE